MLRVTVLFAASISFLAMANDNTTSNQDTAEVDATTSSDGLSVPAATPYNLAYKYRFTACNVRQGQNARATYIIEAAFRAGEISEAELNDPSFHNNVSRFIRLLCPNHR